MRRVIAIIPARFNSSRLPAKPLADICGTPMVVHVAQLAMKSLVDDVFVATDDIRIGIVCDTYGIKWEMTKESHESGTERLAEAIERLSIKGFIEPDDIIMNIQGDEPLIPVDFINDFCNYAKQKITGTTLMATAASPIHSDDDINNLNVVKVVKSKSDNAMYFSRAPIPFDRDRKAGKPNCALRHIGIYAYNQGVVLNWKDLPACEYEDIEKLEQLRALFAGISIAVKTVMDAPPHGVDTLEDLNKVRMIMATRNSNS